LQAQIANNTLNNAFFKIAEKLATEGCSAKDLSVKLLDLGDFFDKKEEPGCAEDCYRASIDVLDQAEQSDRIDPSRDLPSALNRYASALTRNGHQKEAVAIRQRALSVVEASLGQEHLNSLTAANALAQLYFELKNFRAAEPLFRRLVKIKRPQLRCSPEEINSSPGSDGVKLAVMVDRLADCMNALGEPAKALPLYSEAFEILAAVRGFHLEANDILRKYEALRRGDTVDS